MIPRRGIWRSQFHTDLVIGVEAWNPANIVSGGLVGTLANIATGNDATATGSARPAYNSVQINGLPTITFNGSSNIMAFASNITVGAGSTTMFVCIPRRITNANETIFAYQKTSGYFNLGSTGWGTYVTSFATEGAGTLTVGNTYLLSIVTRAVNDIDIIRNGTKVNKTNGTAFPARTGSAIGADPSGIQNGNFDLLCMYTWGHAFTAQEVTDAQHAIAARAGLSI